MRINAWMAMALLSLSGAACGDSDGPGGAEGGGGDGAGGAGGGGGGAEPSCTGTQSDDPQFAQALDVLREAMEANDVPGGAIAVVQDGQLVNLGVMGTKKAGVCDPVTPDTLFLLPYASVTLTSLAVLDAVEEGKLSLTEPMDDLLPLVVDAGAEHLDSITLHHLLTHSSMYTTVSDAQPQESTCTGLAEWYESPTAAVIEAQPGSMADWEDRANIELAALALETVDGQLYPEVIASRVLAPLGMGGTFDLVAAQQGDHALGYNPPGVDGAVYDCPNHHASYGYRGSIRDLVKLAEYMTSAGGGILEPSTHASMFVPEGPSFFSCERATYAGAEWGTTAIGERLHYRSGGSSAGFNQSFLLFPDRGLAVITMINVDTFVTDGVNVELAKIYGVDASVDALTVEDYPQEPVAVQSLVGTYVDPVGFNGTGPRTMVISAMPGDPTRLQGSLTAPGNGPQTLLLEGAWCPDNFKTGTGDLARFWRDDAGAPTALQFRGYRGPPFFRQPD